MDEIKELLETKQYTRLRQKLSELYDADIAAVLEDIPEEDPPEEDQTQLCPERWILPGAALEAARPGTAG